MQLPTVGTKQRNAATVFWVVAVAISVLGLSYALVPLYQLYCQTVGAFGEAGQFQADPNVNTETQPTLGPKSGRSERKPLTVNFHSDFSSSLP